MKIIDIRSKYINEETLGERPTRFNLDIQEVKKEEVKKLPAYELEIGKKEKSKWWRGIKQVSFAFSTHFGAKRYRIKTSFILGCIILFLFLGGIAGVGKLSSLKNDLIETARETVQNVSLDNLFAASFAVKEANEELGSIPETFSDKLKALNLGSAWAEFFLRVSGYYNPRHYLVLFQNNSELRPTGGFIGSYALLKVDQGRVEIQKIEGIFNVSGQQRISVVPPEPIQKISASWSLHDANWFFDFPTSAKAIMWFYEKSGGPTVDGVIAITPELVKTLLEITGPIELDQFGIMLDANNFMDILQYEVEVNYRERDLEDPKEIIGDLAARLLPHLMSFSKERLTSLALNGLEQKEVLFYFVRQEEQAFINYHNWGGAIQQSKGDYLAVVNTNINGFKTDRMIEQTVSHHSRILEDGRVINTVTITRIHHGGASPYEWYNKVNADFLRVYVPKGSLLLKATGHTLEFTDPPLDYETSGFIEYPFVKKIREQGYIDEKTGTRMFEESGKTVFGNWVYVSPGEQVEVSYTYQLPFTVTPEGKVASILLTVQKQPGITYALHREVSPPSGWNLSWQSPLSIGNEEIINQDQTYAYVFSL